MMRSSFLIGVVLSLPLHAKGWFCPTPPPPPPIGAWYVVNKESKKRRERDGKEFNELKKQGEAVDENKEPHLLLVSFCYFILFLFSCLLFFTLFYCASIILH
jgi:hypothetical protein